MRFHKGWIIKKIKSEDMFKTPFKITMETWRHIHAINGVILDQNDLLTFWLKIGRISRLIINSYGTGRGKCM